MVETKQYAQTPLQMREAIANGECPLCGKKYRNIAGHTNRTHGISAQELKDMAGIPKTRPACDPELSDLISQNGREQYEENPELLVNRLQGARRKNGKRNFSKAGREINLQKLEVARAIQQAKIAQLGYADWTQWMRDLNAERYKQTVAERTPKLIEEILNGATLSEVAERNNLSAPTVSRSLRRSGVEINLRRHRMKDPERLKAALNSMQDGFQRKVKELHEQRLQRWEELGKTWDAVSVLAEECGISDKQMRAWLRKVGEEVPDGRSVSPIRGRMGNEKCKNGHDRAIHSRVTKNGRRICRPCETAAKNRWLAKTSK